MIKLPLLQIKGLIKALVLIEIIIIAISLLVQIRHYSKSNTADIYDLYSKSLVIDGSLNIVNRVNTEDRWLLTKTLNYPDFHPWGATVFLSPFYYKAKEMDLSEDNRSPCSVSAYDYAPIAGNIFYLVLSILLANFLFSELSIKEFFLKTYFAFLVGSPLLGYLLFDNYENFIVTNLVLTSGIILCKNIFESSQRFYHWLLLGIAFSLLITVNYWMIPYLISPVILLSIKEKRIQKILWPLLLYLAGVALVQAPNLVNLYLRWGDFGFSQFQYLADQLFFLKSRFEFINIFLAPNGLIFLCPACLLSFIGIYLHLKKTNKPSPQDPLHSGLLLSFFIPFIVILGIYSVLPTSRYIWPSFIIINNYILFQLGFALALKSFQQKFKFFLNGIIIAFSIYTTLFIISHYFGDAPALRYLIDENFYKSIFGNLDNYISYLSRQIRIYYRFMILLPIFFSYLFFTSVISYFRLSINSTIQFYAVVSFLFATQITFSNYSYSKQLTIAPLPTDPTQSKAIALDSKYYLFDILTTLNFQKNVTENYYSSISQSKIGVLFLAEMIDGLKNSSIINDKDFEQFIKNRSTLKDNDKKIKKICTSEVK